MVRTANLFDNPNSRFTFLRYELFPLTCIPMDNNFDKLSQLFISALMLLFDYFFDHNFFAQFSPRVHANADAIDVDVGVRTFIHFISCWKIAQSFYHFCGLVPFHTSTFFMCMFVCV